MPPPSTSTKKPAGSLLSCRYTFLPAAKIVWPSGVLITPLFSTFSANKTTLPPVTVLIWAPFSTRINPPTPSNTGLNGLDNKPSLNKSSAISNVPAYIEPTLNCAFWPKIMPLVLIKYTLPSAFTMPSIKLGFKSRMRFKADQLRLPC